MKKKYRRHSEEFKKEVVDYSIANSKSITQICREFDISPSQFYSWKKRILGDAETEGAVGERRNAGTQEPTTLEMADEIRRLRKELAKSQRREEILKKAALILRNDPRSNMS